MRNIGHKIQTYYRYNGKFFTASQRKDFRINDVFIDGRDYGVKIVENSQDIFNLSFIDPELYMILEEVTVQN